MKLEELLRKHFGLKGKFLLKNPKKEGDRNYLTTWTKSALKSYNKMTEFLYDLALSECVTDNCAHEIIALVDRLDELVNDNNMY